jgi:membrane-bound metal-dependent hydrolase YbcI (DUF457 family)
MDTITHGIVGALTGKALFAGQDVPAGSVHNEAGRAKSSATARVAIVACTLGSMFPDTDIFAGPLAHNSLAIIEWHRNITHSAAMLPFWSLILAAVSIPLARGAKWPAPGFLGLSACYAMGIATHIFLDLVTNFGTMVWSPLRYSRPAWDWVFIVDFSLTGLALVPQLAAWCYRDPRKFWRRAAGIWIALCVAAVGIHEFAVINGYGFPIVVLAPVSAIFAGVFFLPSVKGFGFRWARSKWCRAGLALVCAYIGVAASMHHKAQADALRLAESRHWRGDKVAALPLPPTLTHWVALVSTPEGVWRTTFREPSGTMEGTKFYASAPPNELIARAKALHDVQVYLWFARYPVWKIKTNDSQQTVVEISDVRFFRENVPEEWDDPPSQRDRTSRPQRRAGFMFEVVFDAAGQVVSSGFQEDR